MIANDGSAEFEARKFSIPIFNFCESERNARAECLLIVNSFSPFHGRFFALQISFHPTHKSIAMRKCIL